MMLSKDEVSAVVRQNYGEPLEILRCCGGFYSCPKDGDGKRLGPLVGYAGRYGPDKKQYVGDIYANFAAIEPYSVMVQHLAQRLVVKHRDVLRDVQVFCGAPEGGKSLANLLALEHSARYAYPEQRVLELATDDSREVTELFWKRHLATIDRGDTVVIVEDVCNNFSTTTRLLDLIAEVGGHCVGIVTLLNRSMEVDAVYKPESLDLPVMSLVRQPIPKYEQDDSAVAADVTAGNVVWKPKDGKSWSQLMAAMDVAQ